MDALLLKKYKMSVKFKIHLLNMYLHIFTFFAVRLYSVINPLSVLALYIRIKIIIFSFTLGKF